MNDNASPGFWNYTPLRAMADDEYPDFPHEDKNGRRLTLCIRCLESNLNNPNWSPRQVITVSPIQGAICLYHFLGSDMRVDI